MHWLSLVVGWVFGSILLAAAWGTVLYGVSKRDGDRRN